jgi:rhamnosyltransferase
MLARALMSAAGESRVFSAPLARTVRPKVLVLLAAFNGDRWIVQQIRSIFDQTNVEVHIAIRDDGSIDQTLTLIQSLGQQGRISVTRAETPSGSASQNFFALVRANAAESFDFIAFADQDDIWHADKLSRACKALTATGASGYSSAVTAIWEDGRTRVQSQADNVTLGDFLFEGAGQGCTFVLQVDFYRRLREFFLRNHHLTARVHFHDWATYAVARSWSLGWTFDAQSTLKYRQHAANQLGARSSVAGIAKRISLMRSGWYKTELRGIAELCLAATPQNPTLKDWHRLLHRTNGLAGRLKAANLVARHGRRKRLDRAILVIGALAGWI